MTTEQAIMNVLNAWGETLERDPAMADSHPELVAHMGILARVLCATTRAHEIDSVRSFAAAALAADDVRSHLVNTLKQLEVLSCVA